VNQFRSPDTWIGPPKGGIPPCSVYPGTSHWPSSHGNKGVVIEVSPETNICVVAGYRDEETGMSHFFRIYIPPSSIQAYKRTSAVLYLYFIFFTTGKNISFSFKYFRRVGHSLERCSAKSRLESPLRYWKRRAVLGERVSSPISIPPRKLRLVRMYIVFLQRSSLFLFKHEKFKQTYLPRFDFIHVPVLRHTNSVWELVINPPKAKRQQDMTKCANLLLLTLCFVHKWSGEWN
jgi:hypothetical protein